MFSLAQLLGLSIFKVKDLLNSLIFEVFYLPFKLINHVFSLWLYKSCHFQANDLLYFWIFKFSFLLFFHGQLFKNKIYRNTFLPNWPSKLMAIDEHCLNTPRTYTIIALCVWKAWYRHASETISNRDFY